MVSEVFNTFRRKGFKARSLQYMVSETRAEGSDLKRALRLWDLVALGVGCVIGAGVFVLTGVIAKERAGPAVILSYTIAAAAAVFTALCYVEFAADVPISGSAYNYVDLAFGEFFSWLAGSALLMEYFLSIASVAKGFSGYFATLIGEKSDAFIITFDNTEHLIIDIGGTILVAVISLLLCVGVRQSFTFNFYATMLTVVTVIFTVAAAVPKIETENYTPFFPAEIGETSAIRAASSVFFAYIGFDAMATMAEESVNPSRDLPWSILICLALCTTLYALMSAALVGMIPYYEIDIHAAFSAGFQSRGMDWAGRIVSVGALCGIVTTVFACACSTCRLLMVCGRQGFLPRFLGEINDYTKTPINATLASAAFSMVLTLLLDIETLADMVSMGTLFAFCLVCLASIWRRYHAPIGWPDDGIGPKTSFRKMIIRIVILIVTSLTEGVIVDRELPVWAWIITLAVFFAVTVSFWRLPVVCKPSAFALPFQPVISCFGVLFTAHLMVTLGTATYIRFACWEAFTIIVYLVYGMYHTKDNTESTDTLLENAVESSDAPLKL